MPGSLLTIRHLALRVAAATAAATMLSGCQSIQGTSPSQPDLRVINVSPNSNGLDFYLGKNPFIYSVGFPYASGYVGVNAGTYTVSAVPTGATSVTSAVASTNVTMTAGKRYTVVAGNVPSNVELNAYQDQSNAAPTGTVDLRFLDQSQSVGGVDVYLVPSGGKLTTTNPIITGLTFDSNSGYLAVPAGTYSIVILSQGTIPIATTITLATGAQNTYNAGVARTIVLTDQTLTTTQPLGVKYLCDYDPPGSSCPF